MNGIAEMIASACPGLSAEDIASAVNAIQNPAPPVSDGSINPESLLAIEDVQDAGGANGGLPTVGFESNYPEAFRCVISDDGEYVVTDPYVCTPVGTILATGTVDGPGSYYCKITKTGGEDPEEEGGESEEVSYSAEVVNGDPGSWSGRVASVPLFDVDGNGEVRQHHIGTIVVGSGGGGGSAETTVDEVSIDRVTDEEAEDPDAIQIKNFDSSKSDGSQGLAQRLEVIKEGSGDDAKFSIGAQKGSTEVFLLARVSGKLKYIPLGGSEARDPDDPTEDKDDEDPCSHPGDNSGDSGDSSHSGSGGGDGGGGEIIIDPDDENASHPGDNDCCNCKKTGL